MHSVAQTESARTADQSPAAALRARVAVAGATGYTGQELLRLLSRHPFVALGAAMSSGQTGASSRRLPGLTRVWDGVITPLSAETLATDADVVFLALPDSAARQTMLFSATMPEEVMRFADALAPNAVFVQVGSRRGPAKTITHEARILPAREKGTFLAKYLRRHSGTAIVFDVERRAAYERRHVAGARFAVPA